MESVIDETSEFILRDPYNYKYGVHDEESVPAYILRQLDILCNRGNKDITTPGIINGASGKKTTYSEFDTLSRSVASALFKKGFRNGDTLIYSTDQVERLHVFLLGVWRANGTIRGSYPEDHGEPLLRRIEESNVKWILCDNDNLEVILKTIENVSWDVNVIVYGDFSNGSCISADEFFSDDGQECPELKLKGSDIAVVMPTSGTTGKSKGVILTHERLLRNFQVTKGFYCQSNPKRIFLHLGKATHVTSVQMFGFIAAGQGVVRLPLKGISPTVIFKAIQDYKPYGMNIIGPFMLKLVNDPVIKDFDLTSLEFIGLMGTVIGPKMVAAIKKFPGSPAVTNIIEAVDPALNFQSKFLIPKTSIDFILQIYGSTETLNLSYGLKFSKLERENFEVYDLPSLATGKLAPGCTMAVVNEAGKIVGAGEQGELWFNSNYSCIGYLNNETETAKLFRNGWIRTGDLGYYDDNGFIYVVSRLKEVFHHFGNQVSPSEIEDVLMLHPLVQEACVVPVDDPNGGDLMPKGFIVPKGGIAVLGDAEKQDIMQFVNSRLQDYKHLKGGLEVKQKFVYGPGGKIQRHLL